VERRDGGIDQLAYRASLLIVRDYLASGYYLVVSGGRCFLAPIFESPALDSERRKAALTRLYRLARDRALIERGHLPWIRRAAEALPSSAYNPERVLASLADGPPHIQLERAVENNKLLLGQRVKRLGDVAGGPYRARVAGVDLQVFAVQHPSPLAARRGRDELYAEVGGRVAELLTPTEG
jgi:hypothetical protein